MYTLLYYNLYNRNPKTKFKYIYVTFKFILSLDFRLDLTVKYPAISTNIKMF